MEQGHGKGEKKQPTGGGFYSEDKEQMSMNIDYAAKNTETQESI